MATTIPISKRREGCLALIRNNFDTDKAVEFVMKDCANEPAMIRAKYPERLAFNIVTIGGNGVQQQLNLIAFQQAITQHAADLNRQSVNKANAENEKLRDQNERLTEQVRELEAARASLSQQVISKTDDLRRAEVSMAQGALTGSPNYSDDPDF